MADTDSTATQDPGSASPEVSAPQTASAPQTTPAQPDSSAGGESAWKNVANSANGAIAPQSGQNPSAPAQAQPTASTVSAPPPDAKAVRPGGIRGFIDKTLDSLAGTDTSRLRKDADGNLYVAHETMTRGQQWLKIAAKGIAGAAAGMEAGKGAGN